MLEGHTKKENILLQRICNFEYFC